MMTAIHTKKSGRALVCGSLAYDTIMVFPDRFSAHILPDKIHMLNVAFLVPELRRARNMHCGMPLFPTEADSPIVVAETCR